jgi:ring-1,2-phenylacetyl-CoA epoxidase subunit PaaC
MALDLIGQARLLFDYAGKIEARGRDEDALVYLRDAGDYRNILLVEQPNRDFAVTMMRQLFYAAFAHAQFEALASSKDETLAAIAAKSANELAYHVRHASEWIIRLGDGTKESHCRVKAALDELWPYTGEMFEIDEVDRELIDAAIAPDASLLRPAWEVLLQSTLSQAMLGVTPAQWMQSGGRSGQHSEHLGHLLAELQFVPRAYPGATW